MATTDFWDLVLKGLKHVGAALAVLLVGVIVAIIVRAIVRRLLRRHESSLGPSVVRLGATTVYVVLFGLAVAASLIALGVSPTFVSGITVVILIVLVVALNESVADLAASVIFLIFRPFKRGEMVETMGRLGYVHEILLFDTVLLLPDQELVSLPNSKIHASGVSNYTRMGRIRVDFNVTVGYREDLDHVRRVVMDVGANDERILADPPFEVVVEELTETGVKLRVLPTVAPEHYWAVRSELRERLKARFDAERIEFAEQPIGITVHEPEAEP